MSDELPPLPFAVFDEFGKGADDRVQDYARAAVDAALEAAAQPEQISRAIRKVTSCPDITAGELSLLNEISTAIRAMKRGHL